MYNAQVKLECELDQFRAVAATRVADLRIEMERRDRLKAEVDVKLVEVVVTKHLPKYAKVIPTIYQKYTKHISKKISTRIKTNCIMYIQIDPRYTRHTR